MRFRDYNYVDRGHGVDVPEGNKIFVLINNITGYFAGNNVTKNAFLHFD
jgi:hypothetical protein